MGNISSKNQENINKITRPSWESEEILSNINKITRPSWENYFKEIVKVTATRSPCKRLQVGCIIVKDIMKIGKEHTKRIFVVLFLNQYIILIAFLMLEERIQLNIGEDNIAQAALILNYT